MKFNIKRPTTLYYIACAVLLCGAVACGSNGYDLDGGDQITVGAAFAKQRQCASCHQASATDMPMAGQTSPVAGTMAYGSNLTPDVDTGIGGWADVEVVRAMRAGVDAHQQPLCPSMPLYADMTDVEAYAIVAYLRSLPPVARQVPASMCPPLKPQPGLPDMSAQMPPDLGVAVDAGATD
jgi:hypothetical protein